MYQHKEFLLQKKAALFRTAFTNRFVKDTHPYL